MTASVDSILVMNTATTNGGETGVSGGSVKVGMDANGFTGRVDFANADGTEKRSGTGFLTINGADYTVINSLGDAGSTTDTDLQGMNGSTTNLNKNYALGSNIDASATSTWNANEWVLKQAGRELVTPQGHSISPVGYAVRTLLDWRKD